MVRQSKLKLQCPTESVPFWDLAHIQNKFCSLLPIEKAGNRGLPKEHANLVWRPIRRNSKAERSPPLLLKHWAFSIDMEGGFFSFLA